MPNEFFFNTFQINGTSTRVYINKKSALFIAYVNGKRYAGESLVELQNSVVAGESPHADTDSIPIPMIYVRFKHGVIDRFVRCYFTRSDNLPVCTLWAEPMVPNFSVELPPFDDGSLFGAVVGTDDQNVTTHELWLTYNADLWNELVNWKNEILYLTNSVLQHLLDVAGGKVFANTTALKALTEAIGESAKSFRRMDNR